VGAAAQTLAKASSTAKFLCTSVLTSSSNRQDIGSHNLSVCSYVSFIYIHSYYLLLKLVHHIFMKKGFSKASFNAARNWPAGAPSRMR
jgi:hypothetical protein